MLKNKTKPLENETSNILCYHKSLLFCFLFGNIRPGYPGQDVFEPQARDFEVAKVQSQV